MTTDRQDGGTGGRPLLQVVRGRPDATEVAALTAVVVALTQTPRPAARPPSPWASPRRASARAGVDLRGGWRGSTLPR